AFQASTAMITALGNDPIYCKPAAWFKKDANTDGTQMQVDCFNNAGLTQDSTFSAMYIHQESSCRDEGCPVVQHLVHPGRTQQLDNPVLRGYGDFSTLTNGWTLNGDKESYGGTAAPVIVTDPPAILGELTRASFTPSVSGVTAIPNVPSVL